MYAHLLTEFSCMYYLHKGNTTYKCWFLHTYVDQNIRREIIPARGNIKALLIIGLCESVLGSATQFKEVCHKGNANELQETGESDVECRFCSVYNPCIIFLSKPDLLSTVVRKSRVSLKVMSVSSEHAFRFSMSCL